VAVVLRKPRCVAQRKRQDQHTDEVSRARSDDRDHVGPKIWNSGDLEAVSRHRTKPLGGISSV
jgi:hypothetical protein